MDPVLWRRAAAPTPAGTGFRRSRLPVWVVAAKLYGLYDHDDERTDHSTADDASGVFHLVTVLVWLLFAGAWLSNVTTPQLRKTVLFWALAIFFVASARVVGRSLV